MKYLAYTLLIICVLGLMPACSASVPETAAPKIARVILQPTYPPKASPDAVEVCTIQDHPDRPITGISPVSTRAWSMDEGIRNLQEKAAQLGADAIVNLRHKTQFNVEYSQTMYFVYGDAILWKYGRSSEYLVAE